MNSEELWEIYTDKNPHWLTDTVQFTPEGLRKFFEQTYMQGHKQGVNNGKALAGKGKKQKNESKSQSNNPIADMFKGVMGGDD